MEGSPLASMSSCLAFLLEPMSFPATYALIHSFLLKKSHTKVAQALKKAAKDIVILKDDVTLDGTELEDIILEWKNRHQQDDSSDCTSTRLAQITTVQLGYSIQL